MRKSFLILLLFLTACGNKQHSTGNAFDQKITSYRFEYTFERIGLPGHLNIAYLYRDGIIGRYRIDDSNLVYGYTDKFIVFDSALNRNSSLEKELNKFQEVSFINYQDSLYLIEKWGTFYQIANDKLLSLQELPNANSIPLLGMSSQLFNNETYYAYGCCMGEFGGDIFFYNKLASRQFTFPVSCCSQLLFHKGNFYAYNFSHHMSYTQYMTIISDPSKLFKPAYTERTRQHMKNFEKPYLCCGCNASDSILNNVSDSIRRRMEIDMGITQKEQSNMLPFRLAFTYDNQVFTIRESDTFFHINFQTDSTEILVQKIRKTKPEKYYDRHAWRQSKTKHTYFANSDSKMIFINSNHIRFVEDTTKSW